MTRPNPHIALIYHYDLARALDGEPVDWQAIPANVDAGREGGDLCRAAADFAKRRDLFAIPAPSNQTEEPCAATKAKSSDTSAATESASTSDTPAARTSVLDGGVQTSEPEAATSDSGAVASSAPNTVEPTDQVEAVGSEASVARLPLIAAPAAPNAVGQPVAEPEPGVAYHTSAHGSATNDAGEEVPVAAVDTSSPADRSRLRARIAGLIDQGHERTVRHYWPVGVPPLSRQGHMQHHLEAILAAVRRVETEVGAGWHPDDGPPPHVNTDPRAEVAYPAAEVDEGGLVDAEALSLLDHRFQMLSLYDGAQELCAQIAAEAHAAGRSISVSANPTMRRWTIARAVIAWAASGRTVDDLWFTASLLATHQQCADADATLGGLISQFTIEQGERLYEAAGQT